MRYLRALPEQILETLQGQHISATIVRVTFHGPLSVTFQLLHQMKKTLRVIQVLLVVDNVAELSDEVHPLGWGSIERWQQCPRQTLLYQPRHCDIGRYAGGSRNMHIVETINVKVVDPGVNFVDECRVDG